jgi:hypothetical protein
VDSNPDSFVLSARDSRAPLLSRTKARQKDTAVLPDDWPTPVKIIGDLLRSHPEAASLLAEASHRQALAAWSKAESGIRFRAAQAARLAYEELRRRLQPRHGRPVHFNVGLTLLTLLAAGLALLDLIELSGPLDRLGSVLLALAATGVWVTIAWLAAVASLRRRWVVVSAIGAAAIALGLLLVALHGLAPHPGWLTVGGRFRGSVLAGTLGGAFILALAAGAAALIAHLEPASLLVARRRWHRARSGHEEAARTGQADLGAAVVASEAWLGLVRASVTMIALAGEEYLIEETLALAAALVEIGRPELPRTE